MALSFAISFAVVKIVKSVIRKQENWKSLEIPNPKRGLLEFKLYDDKEDLEKIILSCIADNESYIVKDEIIIKIIFTLVKSKIQNESLVISSNIIRFLARYLLNNEPGLLARIGNIIFLTENRNRFLNRVSGSAVIE